MTLHTPNPNPNAFILFLRKIYNPIGFQKGYNFILFFIFGGALLGFCLARTPYLNINGGFLPGSAPGESYYYKQDWYKIGISIHLLTVIPAGLLAVFQFVPIIRYKALLFHRINGYVILLLLITSNIGALMIARRAFGGSLATQAGVGILAIGTTTAATLSYVNIKRLQIEQHRAWMLRTWAYMGSIITLRIIMIIATQVISALGSFYIAMPCAQIEEAGGNVQNYLACSVGDWTVVHATWTEGVENVAATFQLSFGMALWLALVLHVVGVEMYLALTKAETERLRKVSYERQLERGFKRPGSAGLTTDRFGDEEEWKPTVAKSSSEITIGDAKFDIVKTVDGDDSSEISKPASTLGWDRS